MSNILGSIQVVLTANTSTFASDLDKASAKARASSAQIRKELRGIQDEANATQALFGDAFGVKIPRHLRSLVSELPGVGKALSLAFEGVAVVVFIQVLVEAVAKVKEIAKAFEDARHAAERSAAAMISFRSGLQTSNDELVVTSTHLANQIALLEGKPQNNFLVALQEATVQADKLGDSLATALETQRKTMDAHQVSALYGLITGQHPTGDVTSVIKNFLEEVKPRIDGAKQDELDTLSYVTNRMKVKPTDVAKKRNEIDNKYADQYVVALDKAIADTKQKLDAVESFPAISTGRRIAGAAGAGTVFMPHDTKAAATLLRESILAFQQMKDTILLTKNVMSETVTAGSLTDKKQTRDAENKPTNAATALLANLQEQLKAAQDLLAVSTLDEEAKRKALATNKANLDILKLGQEISKNTKYTEGIHKGEIVKRPEGFDYSTLVDDKTKQQIRDRETAISDTQAQARLNETLSASARTMELHVSQSQRLTSAIQRGAEAAQYANALTQAENELRGQNASAAQTQYRALEILHESRERGRATAAQTLQDLALEKQQQTALNAALLQGAEAYRKAQLNKKLAEIDASNKTSEEKSADKAKATYESQVAATSQIYTDVAKILKADDDRVKVLVAELDLLKQQNASASDLKQVNDEIVQIQDKQRLENGRAIDGARVALDELVLKSQNAAEQIHSALAGAIGGVNDNLAKLMSGQQSNFKSMLQSLSEQMAKSALESIEGSILKSFGFGTGKPDGSANKPYYVRIADGSSENSGGGGLKDIVAGVFKRPGTSSDKSQGGISSTLEKGGSILGLDVGKPDGSAGNPFHVVNDGNGGGGISSLLSGGDGSSGGLGSIFSGGDSSDSSDSGIDGFAANGGDLNSYGTYVVGERGPELFSPGVSGHVTPNHKLGGGGGRSSHTYNIDARGTNAAEVDMRVRRGMQQTHAASVQNAVVMNRELEMRRPSSRSGARF